MREQSLNDRLHPLLAELPVYAPDAGLWPRIRAQHERRRLRARALRMLIPLAAAAALVVAVMLPRSPGDRSLAAGVRESQSLESEWQALGPRPGAPAAELARLHVIDAALQSAYDRGADAGELRRLWQERNEALRGLIVNSRAESITRL